MWRSIQLQGTVGLVVRATAELDGQAERASEAIVHVRLASPDDAGPIAAVLLAAFCDFEPLYTPQGFRATTPTADEITRRLAEGPSWIAVDDPEVVGTVSAIQRAGEIYLRSMAVLPGARGRGVARQLLQTVEAFAVSRRAQRLTLSTTPFLTDAIRLYEQAGFRRTPVPLDLYGTPLIGMVKELAVGRVQPQ